MDNSLQIRSARPDDAGVAAALLYSAYTHTPVTYPLQDDQASGFLERLEHFFRLNSNRFSYQNTQVAVQHSAIVGLVLSFAGSDEAGLNATVGAWLEREARDDEWYIDALAVFKNWDRKGIGAHLMQAAEQRARQLHYRKIALNVAQENTRARNLYAKLQYVVTEPTIHYQRHYVRMVKTLQFS
jgi:ribosomal protein S18 acetylase RimI-like enzyme